MPLFPGAGHIIIATKIVWVYVAIGMQATQEDYFIREETCRLYTLTRRDSKETFELANSDLQRVL